MDNMDKKQVITILKEMAVLLDIHGENPFKIRAYENAANTLENIEEDFFTLVSKGEISKLKGIGKGIAAAIEEMVQKGNYEEYESLKREIPSGVFELMEVPGLGPKKIKLLLKEKGIGSIEELKSAAETGELSELKGFGDKTIQKLLEGIAFLQEHRGQTLFFRAYTVAQKMMESLSEVQGVNQIDIAGSLRRRKETVKDIDILIAAEDSTTIMEKFVQHPMVKTVTGHGTTKSSIVTNEKIAIDLRVVTMEQFPYALLHFTGSKEHNTLLRGIAKKKGWKLNEYGLFDEQEQLIPCMSEEEIYEKLGLSFIPPELREGIQEVEMASTDELPDLVEIGDIKGVFHNHTTYSDGANTLEEMAVAAKDLGLSYLGISDHSVTAFYANGLNEDRIKEQRREIEERNTKEKGIYLFNGIESDILADGSLDYQEEVLKEFDFVIASVHSHFQMTEEEMTERIIKAVQNPYTTMLGHPTGRLLLKRDAYAVDIYKVIDACSEHGVIIEINSNPVRLDLDWRVCSYAKKKGVMFAINPDAHRVEGLSHIQYGIHVARKGGLEAKDILNTYSIDEVRTILQQKKGSSRG